MKNLLERIERIDPEAARYIREDAPRLDSYRESSDLLGLFLWNLTPQGGVYWADIYNTLDYQD